MISLPKTIEYRLKGRTFPQTSLWSGATLARLRDLARLAAQRLLCSKGLSGALVCACSSCRRIQENIHPDVFWLETEGEDWIKIEKVRELISHMEVAPLEAQKKIAILPEAHRMNAAASNAFLKTLEEPGPEKYFMLLTSQPDALLETIRSRCVAFTLAPEEAPLEITPELLAEFEGFSLDRLDAIDSKETALSFSRFSLRKMRDEILAKVKAGESDEAVLVSVLKFEKALELEESLKTNASFSLRVESFLRESRDLSL